MTEDEHYERWKHLPSWDGGVNFLEEMILDALFENPSASKLVVGDGAWTYILMQWPCVRAESPEGPTGPAVLLLPVAGRWFRVFASHDQPSSKIEIT